jgi:hypothetical protein
MVSVHSSQQITPGQPTHEGCFASCRRWLGFAIIYQVYFNHGSVNLTVVLNVEYFWSYRTILSSSYHPNIYLDEEYQPLCSPIWHVAVQAVACVVMTKVLFDKARTVLPWANLGSCLCLSWMWFPLPFVLRLGNANPGICASLWWIGTLLEQEWRLCQSKYRWDVLHLYGLPLFQISISRCIPKVIVRCIASCTRQIHEVWNIDENKN